jgi:hypothetical protein
MKRTIFGFIVLIASSFGTIEAEQITCSIDDVTVISHMVDNQTLSRVLFTVDLDLPEGATVDHAVFRVPNLAVTGLEEDLVLIVVPVAAEWNPATVGWMSPWSENGGEYAWNRAMVYPVRPGFSGTLEGEIFNVVEEWWTGELGNYGLMLMKADPAEYSLGAEVSTLGTALGSAMIEVHYSRIE